MVGRNNLTIQQLTVACRHVKELMDVGVTENFAIRTLELFTDNYAKIHMGGSASPHHTRDVKLWSIEALKIKDTIKAEIIGNYLRVEHGTPRRSFARLVLELYKNDNLVESNMNLLVERYWKLAVLTVEEDLRLNKVARSKMYETPEERWAAAGIAFGSE